jgi:hypothetical protein
LGRVFIFDLYIIDNYYLSFDMFLGEFFDFDVEIVDRRNEFEELFVIFCMMLFFNVFYADCYGIFILVKNCILLFSIFIFLNYIYNSLTFLQNRYQLF